MELYFLRHATAEDPSPERPDSERALTSEGEAEAQAAGLGMRRLGVRPERALTSPLKRARETARLAAVALGIGADVGDDERLAPGCQLWDLEQLIADHSAVSSLLLVGHEPDFSELIGELTGAAAVEIRKAGLARLRLDSVEAGTAVLQWLLPPESLAAIAG